VTPFHDNIIDWLLSRYLSGGTSKSMAHHSLNSLRSRICLRCSVERNQALQTLMN